MNPIEPKTEPKTQDQLVEKYSDTVFDLIASIIPTAQIRIELFQTWIRRISKNPNKYKKYERIFAIKTCADLLLSTERAQINQRKQFDPRSRLNIDNDPNRTKHFEYFFDKLSTQERLLLLLADKYDFSFEDIGAILSIPEDTVKLSILMVYEGLEYNIWRPGE